MSQSSPAHQTQFRNNGFIDKGTPCPDTKPMDKTGDRKEDPDTFKDPLDNFDKLVQKHK
jgi:hypothetical protein